MNTLLAHPQNYKSAGRKAAQIQYLVIHYTGNKGDSAKNNVDYYARTALQTSAHYFVDEAEIWQSVPDEHIAWHCGRADGKYVHASCRNANSIGIEICMWDKAGNLQQGAIARAAGLARTLMAQYGIPMERVVRHYDVTGKRCPAPMVSDEKLWEGFLGAAAVAPAHGTAATDARSAPVYEMLADIPAALRPEVEALMACGALRGDGAGLHLDRSTLRAIVIAKRYCDVQTGNGGVRHAKTD